MNRGLWRFVASLAALAMQLSPGPLCAESLSRSDTARANVADLSEIVTAWRSRQEYVKTLKCTWRSDVTKLASIDIPDPEGIQPPEYLTFEAHRRLTLDGNRRARLDEQGQRWSEDRAQLVPSRKQVAFDGSKEVNFFPEGPVGFPDAHLGPGNIANVIANATTLAIRLVYRPFDTTIGMVDENGLQLSTEQAVYNGSPVSVLRCSGEREKVIWIDPDKAMVPVRYLELNQRTGTIAWQIDLSYHTDTTHGWVPREWTITLLAKDGKIRLSDRAKVVEYHINEEVDDKEFTVEIPAGTYVHDSFTSDRYIVRQGGEKRPVLDHEFTGDNFQELLATEPGERFRKPSVFQNWFFLLNVVILCTLAIIVLYRRMLSKRAQS